MQKLSFDRYRLPPKDQQEFDSIFKLVHRRVVLADASTLATQTPEYSGCYFWVLRHNHDLFKIYIGRTSSLRRRLNDYANNFQIHAPNDYKIRFFQQYCDQFVPEAELDMYFAHTPIERCKNRETELVRQFHPMINQRLASTQTQRDRIRNAFFEYYAEVFHTKLKDGA